MPVYKKINNELVPFFDNAQFVTDWKYTRLISTLPFNFYEGFALIYKNELHILQHSDHYKWNGTNWEEMSKIPSPLTTTDLPDFSNSSAFVYNNKIYLACGDYCDCFMSWDEETGWEKWETYMTDDSGCQALVYNNEIHIFGNYTHHYKGNGLTWEGEYIPNINGDKKNSQAIVYNNELYLFEYKDEEDKIFNYKWNGLMDEGSVWQEDTPPFDCSYFDSDSSGRFLKWRVVIIDNEIHILGTGLYDAYNKHYKWNDTEKIWQQLFNLPYSFDGSDVVVYKNELHLLGGSSNDSKKHYQIGNHLAFEYSYDTDWGIYKSISTLPYEFYGHTALVYNNEIHILGSGVGGEEDMKHYRWNGYGWYEVSTLPHSVYSYYGDHDNTLVIVWNDEIHLFGGEAAPDEHYRFHNNNWIKEPNLPFVLNYAAEGIIFNNELHIFTSFEHYKYNNDINDWETLPNLPFEIGQTLSPIIFNNKIYIFDWGGTQYSSWNGNEWEDPASLPDDGVFGSSVVINNKLHLFGSEENSGDYTKGKRHYIYNGTNWESIEVDLPYEFYSGTVVIYNNKITLLGGINNDNNHYQIGEPVKQPQNGGGVTAKKINNQLVGFSEGAGRMIAKKINDKIVYIISKPIGVDIIPWATASDEQIATILNAYYNNKITLEDIQNVWSVGNKRNIILSAMDATGVSESHRSQTIEMVILDFEHDNLTTPIKKHTKALITIQQKDCLIANGVGETDGRNNPENGYMNSTKTNIGGWTGCARRIWCNTIYYNAFPASFKSMIKTVNKLTSEGDQLFIIDTTSDYIFLPSEVEALGTFSGSVKGEGFQYTYYSLLKDNIYKKPLWGSDSEIKSGNWSLRSPYSYDGESFECINSRGELSARVSALALSGIAPACCL